jgi:hypothetical protein
MGKQPVTGRTVKKVLMTDRVAQTSSDRRLFAADGHVDLIPAGVSLSDLV